MKTKPKLIICSFIFVLGAFLNLFFSTAVHGLLTHKITTLRFFPVSECLGKHCIEQTALFAVSLHTRLFSYPIGYVLFNESAPIPFRP